MIHRNDDIRGLDYDDFKVLAEQGVRAVINAPLRVERKIVGTINLGRDVVSGFDDEDCEILSLIAEQIAGGEVGEQQARARVQLEVAQGVVVVVAAEVREGQSLVRVDAHEAWFAASVRHIGAVGRVAITGRVVRGDEEVIGAADDVPRPRIQGIQFGDRALLAGIIHAVA